MASGYADDFNEVMGLAPEVAAAAAEIRKGWDEKTLLSRFWYKSTPFSVPVSTITPTEPEDPTYRDLY